MNSEVVINPESMNEKRVFDLEERLIGFSVMIIKHAMNFPVCPEGKYFRGQIVRSGSSAALNYGEAQASESRKDFVHKSKIVLKELRETLVCLKIIRRTYLLKDPDRLRLVIQESNELVSIFVKSIKTAEGNTGKN